MSAIRGIASLGLTSGICFLLSLLNFHTFEAERPIEINFPTPGLFENAEAAPLLRQRLEVPTEILKPIKWQKHKYY
jgi:hypothetical protein